MAPVTTDEEWIEQVTTAAVKRARSLRGRRNWAWRAASAAFVAALAATGAVLAASGGRHAPARTTTTPPVATVVPVKPVPVDTSHFYAVWRTGAGSGEAIEEFSTATARPVRQVAMIPTRYLTGDVSLVQAKNGWIWVTESWGPRTRSNLAGGSPTPDSCSGTVVELDPQNGNEIVAFRTPESEWLGTAVPSPDGRSVAYLAGQCDRQFMNNHVVVRDLATGREWSIGADARVCHDLSPVAWSRDGLDLLFGYGASLVAPGKVGGMGYGVCAAPSPSELGTVGALRPASIRSVSLRPAPAGCNYVEAVADAGGPLVLEDCGAGDDGPAALVQFDAGYRVVGTWSLPPSEDGTSLSVSPDGRLVLVDEYQAPIYGSAGQVLHPPTEWVEVFDGSSLRVVRELPGAELEITSAAW